MNKIKQNKITFSLILLAIAITFSSLTFLSLPVLFNYKSKVVTIEKNFYKNFKLNLNTLGNISYKPFPKPHLLVEKASLSLSKENEGLINVSNLQIFISLRDIYLRTFNNLISTQISNANLELKLADLKKIREHLYYKVNKPIIFNDCKIFIKNKEDDVILISPVKQINYKINNKSKIKNFLIDGKIFGLNFKSIWKRSYDNPKSISHNVNIFNPKIEINNIITFNKIKNFKSLIEIVYAQDKLAYEINFDNNKIIINSPNLKNSNFNISSNISLKPFYFDGELIIKKKKVEKIIDILIKNLFLYDKSYLGNFNGLLKIKFKNLDNKLIKNGEIDLVFNEKNIILKEANFKVGDIGTIYTEMKFIESQGEIIFTSKNHLKIDNYIEFAKVFQIQSKKIKNIENFYFDLQKNIGETDFVISNVRLNENIKSKNTGESFIIKNIQNLRSNIRKVID